MKPDTNREIGGLAKTTGLIACECGNHTQCVLASVLSVASVQSIVGASKLISGNKV